MAAGFARSKGNIFQDLPLNLLFHRWNNTVFIKGVRRSVKFFWRRNWGNEFSDVVSYWYMYGPLKLKYLYPLFKPMEWETGYKLTKANEMSSWTSHGEDWEILLVAFMAICPQEQWTMSLWSWGLCSNLQRGWCCERTSCSSITVHPHVPASLFPTHGSLYQSYCLTHNILSLAPQACPF